MVSAKQICRHCAAWNENGFMGAEGFRGTGGGECRKHAPNPDWPQTRFGDWCLEFVERPSDCAGEQSSTWQHISEPLGRVIEKSADAYLNGSEDAKPSPMASKSRSGISS